ncbi:MAG: FtsQ-type POTRA domain-containing protein [Streptococcaceae bacterium]|jgi:cell division protein FtsQ|nr:FtsQ-type POTRA domain-containing protein [Streptococcaceae bacterium]
MSEDFKSPWQIEHEKMLSAQEAEEKSRAKEQRREFLKHLRLNRKSDRTLHAMVPEAEDKADDATVAVDAEDRQEVYQFEKSDEVKKTSESEKKLPKEKAEKGPSPMAWIFPLLRKAWPVLALFLVAFIVSVYSLSPLNRIGSFKVTGNSIVSSGEIATASKLKAQTSIYDIMTHKATIEANVVNASARIESAQIKLSFPNNITIQVREFKAIGYVEQKGKAYNVLANGLKVDESVMTPDKEAANSLVLKEFSNSQVKEFVLAYMTFKPSLQALIRSVSLTPSQSTSDFITIQMSDGNQVKVPLSQMEEKLPYYPGVAKQVQAPQTVDMEVGIFTADTPTYNSEFADDNPAGLSKSVSASISASKAAGSTASSSSSDQNSASSSSSSALNSSSSSN